MNEGQASVIVNSGAPIWFKRGGQAVTIVAIAIQFSEQELASVDGVEEHAFLLAGLKIEAACKSLRAVTRDMFRQLDEAAAVMREP